MILDPSPPAWLVVLAAPFVGSFLGVLIKRLPAGESVIWGRSRCDACGQRLGVPDLVPLLSWIASRARCRYCSARLSLFYPGIELAATAVAIWSVIVVPGWPMWATCVLGWALLVLAVIDVRHLLLPDVITLPLAVTGLAVTWLIEPEALVDHALGAALGFAAFHAIAKGYAWLRGREGLGGGDAKLLAAAGAWVSWQGLPSVVLLAAAAALAVTLARALGRTGKSLSDPVPFGPFLCMGLWLTWLYGPLAIGSV